MVGNILIVDDEERMRHLLSLILSRRGYRTGEAADGVEALDKLQSEPFDMVITDIKMPRMDGLQLLKRMTELQMPCPVVFITAFATVDSAVEAMRQGAADYISKPFEEERIILTVERTLRFSRIINENRELKRELQQLISGDEIVYVSKEMASVMDLASKVAERDSVVLITGESGTGKELLARYIHRASARRGGRFVPVNCAAISPNLVESELFGYEKGAFTGADKRTMGKFEYASGGTIFLDEIGDLPMEAQAKLLRALQEKKIQRVGGNQEIPVDVRAVCATNQDLSAMVERGAFRRDLYFRINVFPLHSPSLRERAEDVIPLARHFLKRVSGGLEVDLTEGAQRVLMEHTWPGNVRELANAMERAVILAAGKSVITAQDLSFIKQSIRPPTESKTFQLPPEGISLEDLEKDLAKQALAASNYNQSAAAKLLGLTRAKFRVLMKQAMK
jgi:DNA-binding NtrC family response regulator